MGDCSLDERARGYLESAIDELIQQTEIIPSIQWVQQELPISSLRDLVLGYAIGSLETLLRGVVKLSRGGCSEEDLRTIDGMLKRRLPEIVEKIERELNV